MADYIPEFLALQQVLLEQKSATEALFHVSVEEKLSTLGKKNFKDNFLGVLRHYFCLSFELANLLTYSKNSEEQILSLVPLYELRYHKNENPKDIYARYHDAFLKQRLQGDVKANFAKLEEATKKPFVIPEEVKQSPYLYNSLVLEVPEFLLRKFSKDFTPDTALNMAVSLHGRPMSFYGLDQAYSEAELLANDAFENVAFVDHSVIYRCNKPLPLKEAKEKGLYPVNYLDNYAYSQLDIPHVTPKVLLVGCKDATLPLNLAFRTKEYFASEVVCAFANPLRYRACQDNKELYALKNVKPIHCETALLKTYLTYDNYDVVVCFGNDLGIGASRKKPEVLPSLNERGFAKSAARQLSELLESAEFVKKDGSLVLINHALDKEESTEVVKNFLRNRKDFVLDKKEFLFPNKMDSDGGFYAILKKVK